MEFRAIFIANQAQLSVRREQLVIRQAQEVTVPMEDITSLLLESQAVTISTAALQKLAEYGVTVYICDEKHLPAALLLPVNRHSRQLKVLKGQIAMTKPVQKRLWQSVVMAKIRNQARCLELLSRPEGGDLLELARSVRSGDPDNCEASAAVQYFPALFGQGFTRDTGCLTNAALNYGYAILRGAVARNLAVHGIEPCLGIFHHSELNQFNLADDLMEPYRPLVDLYVASQVNDEERNLTPKMKQNLFNLTNYMVRQNGKRYRMISAVGRMTESFARVLAQPSSSLELPELIPLESYRYE
ncbi:type II CRISPR-associated endonuclease Cas1 [uncultured Oscillibacter sp.]|uniref:type II CRISPR-associated endonuclease Cas1 n=1 Tax=uncultured Oscillibacter sp. TaxID=876091 RepID=UPI0026056EE3|nr:type II CRISPR-associated endonuclease Cas1 [uncultured Oscillibacter sp.]